MLHQYFYLLFLPTIASFCVCPLSLSQLVSQMSSTSKQSVSSCDTLTLEHGLASLSKLLLMHCAAELLNFICPMCHAGQQFSSLGYFLPSEGERSNPAEKYLLLIPSSDLPLPTPSVYWDRRRDHMVTSASHSSTLPPEVIKSNCNFVSGLRSYKICRIKKQKILKDFQVFSHIPDSPQYFFP